MSGRLFVSRPATITPPVDPGEQPGQPGQPGSPGWVPPVRETHRPLLTSLTLTSPAGEIDLMQRPWRIVKARGLTTVTRRPDTVSIPGRDGVARRRLSGRGLVADAREIELDLFVGHHRSVRSPELLSAEVQRLEDIVDEDVFRDGEVQIRGLRADGSSRYSPCVHTPFTGDMDPLAWWQKAWQPKLRLLMPDPWFRSSANPITWPAAKVVPPMLPFFPLRIGSSTVTGSANPVVVQGNREAWPTLNITGPTTSITCTRGDGRKWTLTPPTPLLAGQTVVVRHDPLTGVTDDLETVEGPAGQPWYRYLTGVLWSLRPGRESVSVVLPGAGDTTSASIAWDYRHRSMV